MTVSPAKFPGIAAMAVLIAMFIAWAWLVANQRSVRLTEIGPAIHTPPHNGWPDMKVEINSADVFELSLLPGLGPSLAERIVEHRKTHGRFESINELSEVKGIGSALIERMRPLVAVERANEDTLAATR